MRTRLLAALGALFALAASAPAATAAPPLPFGHACAPREGALYCPTASDAARMPRFDGLPLDVAVFLPPTGNGPFPTIAMLHGFGRSCGVPDSRTPNCARGFLYRASNGTFSVDVSRLRVVLPTRERQRRT
jgi:hypothetical protein